MATLNDFSFLMVTRYNDEKRLRAAYDSIRRLYPENEIVIVYDNVTAPKLNHLDKHVIEVYSSERVYVSGGYNLALKNCTKKCFVFIHDDTFIAENFLENLLPNVTPTQFCNFSTIEPPLYGDADTDLKPIKDFGRDADAFDWNQFNSYAQFRIGNLSTTTIPSPFGGFFMAGYKDSIESVGMFDEAFKPYFYEDADLMIRLHNNGYTFVHALNCIVYHMGSLTSRVSNESAIAMETTSQLFIKKWKTQWEIIRKYTLENGIPYKFTKFEVVTENCPPSLQKYIDLISEKDSNIKVYINGSRLQQNDVEYLQTLPYLLSTIEAAGVYEIGNLKIEYVQ
jgi:GT2 family glycosyltransferase